MSSSLPPPASTLPPEALQLLARASRHTTPCGDGEVVWRAWGEGQPLVLLHGGSGSWAHWIRNIGPLAAAGRRVLVPDLPGFGDSAVPPGNKDADGVAPVLAEGLPALVGNRPVDVVGFSFGGLTAGLLTAAHPERVRHLVLVGAPGLGVREQKLPLTAWRHLDDPQAQRAAHRRNLQALMLHDPAAIDELAVSIQAANAPHDRLQRRRLAMTDILRRTLPTITCPLDAIYGEHDALYSGGLTARLRPVLALAPRFGSLELVADAGHWVQYEAAAEFNRILLRLLARPGQAT